MQKNFTSKRGLWGREMAKIDLVRISETKYKPYAWKQ
jgi:hypothetical protein